MQEQSFRSGCQLSFKSLQRPTGLQTLRRDARWCVAYAKTERPSSQNGRPLRKYESSGSSDAVQESRVCTQDVVGRIKARRSARNGIQHVVADG